ncbi:hypothetical protein AAG906_007313 [Vitis piasezkii]
MHLKVDLSILGSILGWLVLDWSREIPQPRFNIFSLRYLDSEIPSTLLHCKEIQVLGPSLNQFTGSRPREIGNLSTTSFGTIEQIDLLRNSLIGAIPTSFGNLTALQMLNLGGNNIQGNIPKELGPRLTQNHYLSGSLPSGIGTWLPDLEGTGCTLTLHLDFLQRLKMMIDVASGLEYLHHNYSNSVVQCDLKPNKVLLDDDMVAHISNFNIAKLLMGSEFLK